MTDLMTHALHEKKIKNAFSEGISYSIHNLLDDKDTNNKLKNFLYSMLISTDEEGGIKSLIDILVEKVIRKKNKESNQADFNKLF